MNTEELKKLAMAATPGPWAHGVTWIEHLGGIVALGNTARSKQDVAYVASANPATILALIAERDELLAALKDARRELAYAGRQEAHDAASAAIAKGGEV